MTRTIHEPGRDLPIEATYDIAIVGGGIAGVAAAIAAARQGLSAVLIERQFGLGGLATLGNVIVYLPICDGNGRKVMGGIAEELLHLAVAELKAPLPKARFVPVPECWTKPASALERSKRRYLSSFNPYYFQIAMERAIEAAGVSLMYDTRVCHVVKSGNRLTHLIVENKSGRMAIAASMFIDASGDADVCALAGCDVEIFPNNVLAGWHYEIHDGEIRLNTLSNPYDKEHGRANNAVGPFYDGVDHKQVTRHVLDSRKMLWEKWEQKQLKQPDHTLYPFGVASIPCFRVTRRLRNRFSLGKRHRHVWLDDTIGFTSDWRRRGPVYPLTMNSMQADRFPNLFAVGRCMSSDNTLVDVTRAIPTCAVTGEAAAVAASILIKDNIASAQVPLDKLRRILSNAGNVLDPQLLKEAPPPEGSPEAMKATQQSSSTTEK